MSFSEWLLGENLNNTKKFNILNVQQICPLLDHIIHHQTYYLKNIRYNNYYFTTKLVFKYYNDHHHIHELIIFNGSP
jgi:ribonuclease HIII